MSPKPHFPGKPDQVVPGVGQLPTRLGSRRSNPVWLVTQWGELIFHQHSQHSAEAVFSSCGHGSIFRQEKEMPTVQIPHARQLCCWNLPVCGALGKWGGCVLSAKLQNAEFFSVKYIFFTENNSIFCNFGDPHWRFTEATILTGKYTPETIPKSRFGELGRDV